MTAPVLEPGASVRLEMTSGSGTFSTTVTVGKRLGLGGSAGAYRIVETSDDRCIKADVSVLPLTDLVLRLESRETGRQEERRKAIKFLEEKRPGDPGLRALVPMYATGIARFGQGIDDEMLLSAQLLKFAGQDLRKAMPDDGFGWQEVCAGLVGISLTLARLHSLGWVHRDVTPDNLFTGFPITSPPEFLLGDLGIITKAHMVRPVEKASDGTTTVTVPWQKQEYTPPEVLRSGGEPMSVTEHLDVWQLATTMAMLATGQRPFRGWLPGRVLARQEAYTDGVIKGRFDPDVITGAPQALRLLLAQAWTPEPSKRPRMSQLTVALQEASDQFTSMGSEAITIPVHPHSWSDDAKIAPRPSPLPHRMSTGFKALSGAAILVITLGLIGATNAGQTVPSLENLRHNTSNLLGQTPAKSPSAADVTKAKTNPSQASTKPPATATHAGTPGVTPRPANLVPTLGASNPGLFSAGPLANEPVIGTLKFPQGGACACGEFAQIKIKTEVTNTSKRPIKGALGGTSAKTPAGPYLVFAVARSAVWKAEPGAGVSAIRYPIDKTHPYPAKDDVILVPANPDRFARMVDARTMTWATHWSTQTVAAGQTYRDQTFKRADLVFTAPSGALMPLVVIWVTDHGVLIGPLSDLSGNPADF